MLFEVGRRYVFRPRLVQADFADATPLVFRPIVALTADGTTIAGRNTLRIQEELREANHTVERL